MCCYDINPSFIDAVRKVFLVVVVFQFRKVLLNQSGTDKQSKVHTFIVDDQTVSAKLGKESH